MKRIALVCTYARPLMLKHLDVTCLHGWQSSLVRTVESRPRRRVVTAGNAIGGVRWLHSRLQETNYVPISRLAVEQHVKNGSGGNVERILERTIEWLIC